MNRLLAQIGVLTGLFLQLCKQTYAEYSAAQGNPCFALMSVRVGLGVNSPPPFLLPYEKFYQIFIVYRKW